LYCFSVNWVRHLRQCPVDLAFGRHVIPLKRRNTVHCFNNCYQWSFGHEQMATQQCDGNTTMWRQHTKSAPRMRT
jgi:hypothetical protein